MKKNNYLFGIIVLFVFSSCINEKYIYQCNKIYKIVPGVANPPGTTPTTQLDTLYIYHPQNGFKGIISDKGDYLTFKAPAPKKNYKETGDKMKKTNMKKNLTSPDTIIFSKPLIGWRAEITQNYYFPETELDTTGNIAYKLKYFDTKPVIQALTIPLKIRPSIDSAYPSQAETSFNVGAAFGWKFTHNVYDSRKNIFGQNTNRYSLSPGIFLGTGATDLKPANTDPDIAIERKAAIITTGGFLMIGFNSINFGYALGGDFSTGKGSKDWVYQGKLWHGIIFAIDILK